MKTWHLFVALLCILIVASMVLNGWLASRRERARRVTSSIGVVQTGGAEQAASHTKSSRASKEAATMDSESQTEDADQKRWAEQRRLMVQRQLAARDITDQRVLEAMQRVARHKFVPRELLADAYRDGPLPIGKGQTISQPYIVALMTQLAKPRPDSVALDVGTGSGYQAAVLAELCKHVYSIEIVPELAETARRRLTQLGYRNVTVRCGDGYQGWSEHAPFDLIIVAAAPDHIPKPLIEQLKPGGRLVIPVGTYSQNLWVVEKDQQGHVQRRKVAPVAFVPMTGRALDRQRP